MQCLNTLVGLRGGCAEVTTDADVWTDPHLTRRELESFIDQNDYPDGVDEFFQVLREQAVRELIAGINKAFQDRYISRTVAQQLTVGDAGTTLKDSPAATNLKGVKLWRSNDLPDVAYRLTRLAFIGDYTGDVDVLIYDGVTGQLLTTQTIAAIAGQEVSVYVNNLYRVRRLLICYDATGIDAYKTQTGYASDCSTCPDRWAVNGIISATPFTAEVGSPLTQTIVNDMGGLIVDVSMECDHQAWLCGIRQQLAMPLMWKVCELACGYGANVTGRNNTANTRDKEQLKERQLMFNDRFESAFAAALKAAVTPNDPTCFVCVRRSRIANAIP